MASVCCPTSPSRFSSPRGARRLRDRASRPEGPPRAGPTETPGRAPRCDDPRRSPSRPLPWRELALTAGFVLLGWPVALLAVGLPLSGAVAVLAAGSRRITAAAVAIGLFALLVGGLPAAAPFTIAVAVSFAAAVARLRGGRLGYPELSVCTLAGVALAGLLCALLDPAFYGRVSGALEAATLEQARAWTQAAERWGAGPRERLVLEELFASSVELSSRTWPAAVFGLLWVGSGAGWALAARRATGPAAARVRVGERCASFRLPDAWLWGLVAGLAGYLLTPEPGSAARVPAAAFVLHELGLNLAVVAAGMYAWQGLAVALYFLERRGVRPLTRVLLVGGGVLLFPLPALVFALGLGLLDAWRDLRSRAGPASPGAAASP